MLVNERDDMVEHAGIGFGLHAMTEIEDVAGVPVVVGEPVSAPLGASVRPVGKPPMTAKVWPEPLPEAVNVWL